MIVNWQPYVTPTVVGASATLISAVLVYLLNHRSGRYKNEIVSAIKEEITIQTCAIVKTQTQTAGEIVSAIKELKA
jgi:hypothetical protein